MGRKKLEIKPIEDKHNRSVTFSKRRSGLVKKARHLSLLCDADVAVIVFSAGGRLYEFSSGSSTPTNSVEHILSRYHETSHQVRNITTKGPGKELQEPLLQGERFQTCKELLQAVDRFDGEHSVEELSVNDLTELEQELDATLVQTRLRKTQLMMEYISTLREKEKKLAEEKQQLEKHLTEEKQQLEKWVESATAAAREENKDEGEDLNNLATNQISSPQQLVTLPLFYNG